MTGLIDRIEEGTTTATDAERLRFCMDELRARVDALMIERGEYEGALPARVKKSIESLDRFMVQFEGIL